MLFSRKTPKKVKKKNSVKCYFRTRNFDFNNHTNHFLNQFPGFRGPQHGYLR